MQEDFGLEFLRKKCQESHTRIYGFILYTRADPYVVKVLRDNDFWKALDEISGPHWPIFSVKPLEEGKIEFPKVGNDMISYMVPKWHEPNTNKKFLKFFGIESSLELPCFVTFIWDDDDKLRSVVSKIDGSSENAAYESLSEIVSIITNTEAEILSSYKLSVNVFREVSQNLEARKFRHSVRESIKKVKDVVDFFGIFR